MGNKRGIKILADHHTPGCYTANGEHRPEYAVCIGLTEPIRGAWWWLHRGFMIGGYHSAHSLFTHIPASMGRALIHTNTDKAKVIFIDSRGNEILTRA